MKLANITNQLGRMTGRTGLVLKKYSPEILLVVGIGGTVVSTVLACRATLKVEEVLDNHQQKVDKSRHCRKMVESGSLEASEYTEKDYKKDLTVIYTQTAVDFVKLYGPAVTLGVASVACIIGGHGIMKKRNVALVAAYKAIEESFNAYRERVREEYGEEKDYMFKHNLRSEQVTEVETGEDGKEHKVKKTKLKVVDGATPSQYARFFDEYNINWSKHDDYNLVFLRSQQNYFNDILLSRGHVFLNEVYDALGLERSKAGAIVGWVINKDGSGDNFIDFGIFNGDSVKARDFVNGYERSILLDFNVDGVIYDLI